MFISPRAKHNNKKGNPTVTPIICGSVPRIPKLKPEYKATKLFGPGVNAATIPNKVIERISGCITMRLVIHFLLFERDE